MMGCLAAMMPDRDAAMAWLARVRDSKPRYIRDQVQALTQTVSALEPEVAARTLEYCMANGIDGAADFRAIAARLAAQSQPRQGEARVIRMNPLGGGRIPGADIQPDRSDITDYDALLGGG